MNPISEVDIVKVAKCKLSKHSIIVRDILDKQVLIMDNKTSLFHKTYPIPMLL